MSDVNALADRLFATILDRYPVDAALMGFDLGHESLTDHSEEAGHRYRERLRDIGDAARRIRPGTLSDRMTLGIVLHEVRTQIDDVESRQVEFGISANIRTTVPGTLACLPRLPVDTPRRRAGYLRRLRGLDGFFATLIARHRRGFEDGLLPVRHLVEQAVELMDGHLRDLGAFDVVDGGGEVVRSAIRSYRDFLVAEAVPLGRDAAHAGLCWLPDGDAVYRKKIRAHTTEDLDPEDLHATGVELVEELKREFARYGDDVFHRIRDDPRFRHTDAGEVLDAARKAVAKAEAVAPQWFRTTPDAPCVVREAPPAVPAHVPPHYFPAAEDGSRPGTYFVNTKEPHTRLRIKDEATAFHEAVPGHHFEHSRAALLEDVPVLRRKAPISVFSEGWALYCERLADEMGLYSSDESRLGMLTMDAMRAGRLVVDTGLHARGWSRARAVRYLAENTPMTSAQIESEVDRYVAEPGQALAYAVGRLKFRELRRKAEDAGKDVRDFHEVVLSQGRLTLALLDDVVTEWIAGS
ncbi:Uncharacterized conserved protein, DUF885 familyt [Lentzea xinjiangensis]|uniref:Uncharacterized conserved protein, DUF885 familyt n=1 Tax=Lentzea xinjiangensis TaxID=402600 RepID=A0A1H9EYW8_9PSEU|nr:DUF885 domain-containing protein [Lentzea xinjiangensis]SEQ30916.1 Uncharacterized conserved protein, DUF885 familyt [Lentzea xinjiangensis]